MGSYAENGCEQIASMQKSSFDQTSDDAKQNEKSNNQSIIPASCLTQSQHDTQSITIPQRYLDFLLREFGYTEFRSIQWSIIRSIIQERRDNCAAVAAGYGKSLTYLFPALFLDKVVIVISPLIALIHDQMFKRFMRNRACIFGLSQTENVKDILDLKFNVIYTTAEHLICESGLNLLRSLGENLMLIAVNEADCISQWGHDFRPAYRQLSVLRKTVPEVPILALTGADTPQIQQDICTQLSLHTPQMLKSGFDRPNLYFIVKPKSASRDGLGVWCDISTFVLWAIEGQGCVIIYCNTVKDVQMISMRLSLYLPCRTYHSSLTLNQRKEYLNEFLTDRVRVLVTTKLFGMGIDKQNVRLIIHYGAPGDLTSYYKQVGRAGRDGLPAKCLLLHNSNDWMTHKMMQNLNGGIFRHRMYLENLDNKVSEYTKIRTCRRKFILEYFGDEAAETLQPRRECCDNCLCLLNNVDFTRMYDGLDEDGMLDLTHDAEIVLSLLQDLNGRFGLGKVIAILRGSFSKDLPLKYKQHRLFGKGSAKSVKWFKFLISNLQALDYISVITKESKFGSYCVLERTARANDWLNSKERPPIKIEPYNEALQFLKRKSIKTHNEDPARNNSEDDESQNSLMKALLRLRTKLCTQLDVMPYEIATSTALNQLVRQKPLEMQKLRECELDGFYDEKYDRFGQQILACIKENLISLDTSYHIKTEDTKKEMKDEHEIENSSVIEIDHELKTERRLSEDIWDDCEDNELSRIADALESSGQNINQEKFRNVAVDNVTENIETEILEDSECELDMLLADLEQMQHDDNYLDNVYTINKKRAVMQYVDSESSNEGEKDKSEERGITPRKRRKLPSWMSLNKSPKKKSLF